MSLRELLEHFGAVHDLGQRCVRSVCIGQERDLAPPPTKTTTQQHARTGIIMSSSIKSTGAACTASIACAPSVRLTTCRGKKQTVRERVRE
jgi:hypothetical protein